MRSTIDFLIPPDHIRGIESGEIPEITKIKRETYKLSFRSLDGSHLLYTKSGTPDILFRGDWIVTDHQAAFGIKPHAVHFLSGVTVHQKREVQQWVQKLRVFLENETNPITMKGGSLYHIEEIERLLNMPVGNSRADV